MYCTVCPGHRTSFSCVDTAVAIPWIAGNRPSAPHSQTRFKPRHGIIDSVRMMDTHVCLSGIPVQSDRDWACANADSVSVVIRYCPPGGRVQQRQQQQTTGYGVSAKLMTCPPVTRSLLPTTLEPVCRTLLSAVAAAASSGRTRSRAPMGCALRRCR